MRDGWWEEDFLGLMARRWRLGEVRRALDVGCGAGHWGQRLLPWLHPDAVLQGIDHEPAFVALARDRARGRGVGARTRYAGGRVQALPFPDGSFDLVTCQTVLMHIPDVPAALAEMVRVLRPGGLLALSEPDNGASLVAMGNRSPDPDPARLVDRLRLHLVINAGQRALGWGNDDVGGLLPGMLAAMGLSRVRCWLNDRCTPLVPPYADRLQQAELAAMGETARLGDLDAPRAREAFVAGGGDPAEFDRLWRVECAAHAEALSLARAGRLSRAGGAVQYLVSGRRP